MQLKFHELFPGYVYVFLNIGDVMSKRSSRFLESLTFNFSQGSQWWWIQTFIAQNKGAGGSPRSATGSMLPEPPTLNPINTLKPSPKTIQFPFIKESRQCQLWLGAEAITLSRWKASVSSMGFNLCLLKLVQCYNCLNWLEIGIFFCYVFQNETISLFVFHGGDHPKNLGYKGGGRKINRRIRGWRTLYQIPQAGFQPHTKWTVPNEWILLRNNKNKLQSKE